MKLFLKRQFGMVIFGIGLGLTMPIRVSAEVPAAPSVSVRLEDLLEEARQNNAEIRAARAEWQAAKKRIVQAWALPDPMAGFDIMGEMSESRVGPEENRFMISQKIPFPLKLWKKRSLAVAASRAAEQRYLAIQRDILNELRQAYYALYEADASLEVIAEIQDLLKKFEGVAQARYSNRQGSQRDVAKSQAEVSLSLEQVYMLEQKRDALVALMNYLLHRSPLEDLGKLEKPVIARMEKTLPELITLAVENRQEIKSMEAMVEKSRHARALARMQWIPDLNAGFTYTWVGAGMTTDPEDGKDSWMFPLTINVPLWQNRLIPAFQEAGAELEAAEAKLTHSQHETYYEVREAYVRYTTASKITALYESAVIPQANLALSSDQAGYETGEGDFLNLLDSERIYLNAKLTYIKVYAEVLRSHADIQKAVGLDLTED